MTAGGFEVTVNGRRMVLPDTFRGTFLTRRPTEMRDLWQPTVVTSTPPPDNIERHDFELHGEGGARWLCPAGRKDCCIWRRRHARGREQLCLELASTHWHPIKGETFTIDEGAWCMEVAP